MGKAKMDIIAERLNDAWQYKTITIRIKSPPSIKQTIQIIPSE